jgi:hypothetical protein
MRELAAGLVRVGHSEDRNQLDLAAGHIDLQQLHGILERTRDLIRQVDNVRDAARLVRRSNATEKLLDEALKSCRLLNDEQFNLKQDAAEAHLRTQRRAGELLAQVQKHRGGRPPGPNADKADIPGKPATLDELGIDPHDSHRWQLIASLPVDRFEDYISVSRTERQELTTARLLTLASRLRKQQEERAREEEMGARLATLIEYQKTRAYLWSVIWLDPAAIAPGMEVSQRREELATIARLRVWLDDFERALRGEDRQLESSA